MLATLLVAVAAAASIQEPARPAPVDVQARIHNTYLYLSFDAQGLERDPRLETRLSAQFGAKAVLAGKFHGANVTVMTEIDEPHRSSAEWRKSLSHGEGFEVGGVACSQLEQKIPGDDLTMVHYNAYPVAAGFVFDVHVSGMRSSGEVAIDRPEFEELVRSLRVQYVRRGLPSELPASVREAMTRALTSWPKWREGIDAEIAARKDDAALAFTLGEMLRFAEAPKAEIVAAHARAGELFAALKDPPREQRVAWMLSEESHALALLTSDKPAEAVPHFEKARALATETKHAGLAGTTYNLACALARLSKVDAALEALAAAIAADERYRKIAATDTDLASLSKDPRFQQLLGND
jgi:tetratricopeptide (TPR) repeat protein